jgi:hypothetical protein
MRVADTHGRNLPLGHNLPIHAGERKTQAGASNIGAYDIPRFDLLRIPGSTGQFLLQHRLTYLGYKWMHGRALSVLCLTAQLPVASR